MVTYFFFLKTDNKNNRFVRKGLFGAASKADPPNKKISNKWRGEATPKSPVKKDELFTNNSSTEKQTKTHTHKPINDKNVPKEMTVKELASCCKSLQVV